MRRDAWRNHGGQHLLVTFLKGSVLSLFERLWSSLVEQAEKSRDIHQALQLAQQRSHRLVGATVTNLGDVLAPFVTSQDVKCIYDKVV